MLACTDTTLHPPAIRVTVSAVRARPIGPCEMTGRKTIKGTWQLASRAAADATAHATPHGPPTRYSYCTVTSNVARGSASGSRLAHSWVLRWCVGRV